MTESVGLRDLLDLDRLVHEPARLALLSMLGAADEVDFKFLETATGLTKGNLNSHLAKLEEAGYLSARKEFRNKIPVTSYAITELGRSAYERYRHDLFAALRRR